MIRALICLVFAASGCSKPCHDGTLLLNLDLGGIVADRVVISANSRVAELRAPNTGSGTVEVQFPSTQPYHAGDALDLEVSAYQGGILVGQGTSTGTLPAGCLALTVSLLPTVLDLTVSDSAMVDGSTSDAGGCIPADCSPSMPVCDGACRGCRVHSECPSLVCNSDGSCADAGGIVYVDNGSPSCSDSGTGLAVAPYCSIGPAISSGKIIRVLGSPSTYGSVLVTGGTVVLVGPGVDANGVRISPSAKLGVNGASPGLSVNSNSSDVTLDGFEVTGIGGTGALYCAGPSIGPSLTVRRSYLHDVSGTGIEANKCRLTVDRTQVGPNCQGGGIITTGAQYAITNNFIIANVSPTFPAVTIDGSELSGGGGFRGNTVAKNQYTSHVGGIFCNTPATIYDSIVWGNTGDIGGTSTCTLTNVVSTMNPDFVDASAGNFHLAGKTTNNNACCVDKVSSSPLGHDFDGHRRPLGAAVDIGAHELP